MQKIVNGIAIASGVISLTVVGTVGYVFIRKDAIIENVKSKVMEAVMPSIGGGIGDALPDFTGGATPLQAPTERQADQAPTGIDLPKAPF